MKIDYVKIALILLPLIEQLVARKVSKNKTNLYQAMAKSEDKALDSLQELAIKIVSDPNKTVLDIENLKTGVSIFEANLVTLKDRIEIIKRISKQYEQPLKID